VLIANYRYRQGSLFCSKQCARKWLGDQYGFERYPEHKWRKRKYNWDAVWKAHIETGYGYKKLSKQLGIPSATIASILRRYYHKMKLNEYRVLMHPNCSPNQWLQSISQRLLCGQRQTV
jgi:hypothetical protein